MVNTVDLERGPRSRSSTGTPQVGRRAAWTTRFDALSDVARVRHEAGRFLVDHGIDDIDVIVLLLSEIVTNALRHGHGPRVITVRAAAGVTRVEVRDAGGQAPVVLAFDPERPGGNGMRIVATAATAWGVVDDDDGKTVWFEHGGDAEG